MDKIKTGIERIADERSRQIEVEGYTPQHDNEHQDGWLAVAGACFALSAWDRKLDYIAFNQFPFDNECFKVSETDRIRNLEKAGALIAAEIDRLLRLETLKKI